MLLIIQLFATEQRYEGVGWLDIFSYEDDSKHPHLLLIGDSIVKQYADGVAEELKGKMSVTRFSTSKSICSSQYLPQLSIALTQNYQLILINNGLHDFESSNDTYKQCFKKTLDYLRKKMPHSTILLVATTGVKGDLERNKIVRQRNSKLKELSEHYNMPYIDLYSLTKNKSFLWQDAYHFTKRGVRLLKNKIVFEIIKAAKHAQ